MAAKRHRDGEISPPPRIPPPPSRSSAVGAITPSDGANALPTLTNWGGGLMRNGAVVSNARLTDQQRSTVQRSVCTYFLQNKCRKGADCQFSHDAVVPKQTVMCVFHFAGKCKNGQNCIYSHDGKLQPCKFLFGRGKCEHGSRCRFSHDTPSPEALQVVREQWKNGGIKIAKDTIESCELHAFDSYMSLNRVDFNHGTWGLNAWENFVSIIPSCAVTVPILCSGGNSIRSPSASEDVVSSHVGDSKHAKFSISDAGAASEHFSSANVTHDKQSLQEIPSQLPPPLERGNLLSEPEVGQGDGSEFWS